MDRRFDKTDKELSLVKTAVLENSHELKQIRQAAAITSGVLDEKVDRAEVAALVERAVQKQR